MLRIITDKPDLVITDCETQKDMKRLAGSRSICLDAYGTDSSGKRYDLEIQRQDKGADPHRARYRSSVTDIENLHSGQEFKEIPDTYTIFIYVNGEYLGESDLGKLMHDFNCIQASDMNFELMADRTRYLKEDPKGVSEMCKITES